MVDAETQAPQPPEHTGQSMAVAHQSATPEGVVQALTNVATQVIASTRRADSLPRQDTQFILSRELADLQPALESIDPSLLPPSLRSRYEHLVEVIGAAPTKSPLETRVEVRPILDEALHWLERAGAGQREASSTERATSHAVTGERRSSVPIQAIVNVLIAQLCFVLVVIAAWRVLGSAWQGGSEWTIYVVGAVVLIVATDLVPPVALRWSK